MLFCTHVSLFYNRFSNPYLNSDGFSDSGVMRTLIHATRLVKMYARSQPVIFASAARAPDCLSSTFTDLQTIDFSQSDSGYTLTLGCNYNAGLFLRGASGTASTITNVKIMVDGATIKTRFSIDSTLYLSAGSSLTVSGSSITGMTYIDVYTRLLAADSAISFINNNILLSGSNGGGLLLGAGMPVVDGSKIVVKGNTIGTSGTTSQIIRVYVQTATAATLSFLTPVVIEDNTINCVSSCVSLTGIVNATVRRNSFTSTVSGASVWTLFDSSLYGGALDWDASNNLFDKAYYAFNFVLVTGMNPLGPSRVLLNNTRPSSVTINSNYATFPAARPTYFNLSGVIASAGASLTLGTHLYPTASVLDLAGSTWGSAVSISGVFPKENELNFRGMTLGSAASINLVSVTTPGKINVEDCTFANGYGAIIMTLTTIDSASVIVRRNAFSSTGSSGAVRLFTATCTRIGTGIPEVFVGENNFRFISSDSDDFGVWIRSSGSAIVPLKVTIADNSIDMTDGNGIYLDLSNADNVTIRRNAILTGRSIISATLVSSRIFYDQTNTYAPASTGGSILIQHTSAPLDGNFLNVSNARLNSISYVYPAAASPANTQIVVRNVVLISNIVVELGMAARPDVELFNIMCSGSAMSSYAFNTPVFYHNFSTYTGGLRLSIVAESDIALTFLIISATSQWTLEAPRLLLVQYNILPAIYMVLKQTSANHELLFDHNVLISTFPAISYPYYISYGLLLSWSRKGSTSTAIMSITNNSFTFTPSTARSDAYAFYIDSDDNSDTTTNMIATISDNNINAGKGIALRVEFRSTDVTIQRNTIVADEKFISAQLTNSKIIFDRSNVVSSLAPYVGTFEIRHITLSPRDDSIFNISGIRCTSVIYTIAGDTFTPLNHQISVTNMLLKSAITIDMASAIPKTFDIYDIQTVTTTTSLSSYSVKGINFYHNYSTYYGGLTLNINAPLNISLANLIIGMTSSWTLNAPYVLNISYNQLPALYIRSEQTMPNHALFFDGNVILSSNPAIAYPFYINYAILLYWIRSGGGSAFFSCHYNSFSFVSTTADSRGLYIDTDDSQGFSKLDARIFGNEFNADKGYGLDLRMIETDLLVLYNTINAATSIIYGEFKNSRVTFDQTNSIMTNGGTIDLLMNTPRNGNVFNVSYVRIKMIRYRVAPAADVSLNHVISVTSVNLDSNLYIDLASTNKPLLILEDITCVSTSSKSFVGVKTIDFYHSYSTYNGGLDLNVVAPRNITLSNLVVLQSSSWTLTAPFAFVVSNNKLPALYLVLTQTANNPRVAITGNMITSANPAVSYPYYINYAILFDWTRNGLGNAAFLVENNTIRFSSTSTSSRGIYLTGRGVTSTNAVVSFFRNNIDNLNGYCFDIDLENSDLVFSETVLATNAVGIQATLRNCRIALNESNRYSINGGDIIITHAASPRDGNIFNITNQRLGSISYTVTNINDAPQNDVIVASDLVLASRLVIRLANSQKPLLRIMNIQSGTAKSSIQVNTLDIVHNFSSYPGGLDLTINAPNSVILHNLVIGTASYWAITSGRLFNVTNCKLSSVRVELATADGPNPTFIFENNVVDGDAAAYTGNPYYVYYGLFFNWLRAGTGTNGMIRITNNIVSFRATTSVSNRGLFLNAAARSGVSNPANIITTIVNNSISSPNGYCFDLYIFSSDVTVRENTFATSPTGGGLHLDMTDCRVTIDDSNLQSQNGGSIDIEHLANPRNNNYINISDEIVASFRYAHPKGAVTTGDTVLVNNIVLQKNIVVDLAQSTNPTVLLRRIVSYSLKSRYFLRTVDFIHGGDGSTYVGGLDLNIEAPLNITLFGLTVSAPSYWTFLAPAVMRILNSNLDSISVEITQTYINPLIDITGNTFISTAPYYGNPYYFYYAICLIWTRTGLGSASFGFTNNKISFASASTGASHRGMYLQSSGASSSVTPMVARITDNAFTAGTGFALQLSIESADITIRRNLLYATGCGFYSDFKDVRVAFDETNDHLQGGGYVTMNDAQPRNGSSIALKNERIAAFTYTITPATYSTRNLSMSVENMIFTGAMRVDLASSVRPTVSLEAITASVTTLTESYIKVTDVDRFIHHDCTYNGGLDMSIQSPNNITLYNLRVLGASNYWDLQSPNFIKITDNYLQEVVIVPVTNGESPSLLFTRNVFKYSSGYYINVVYGYVGLLILWARNAAGTPYFEMSENEFTRESTSTSVFETVKIISNEPDKSSFANVNIFRNVLRTKETGGITLYFLNADVTVVNNSFINYVTSTSYYTFYSGMTNCRVTFDESNAIAAGAGGIALVHASAPRPNNVFIVSKAIVGSLTYSVTGGTDTAKCDRIAFIESSVDYAIVVNVNVDVNDGEYTVYGCKSATNPSATVRSTLLLKNMYNSFFRIERNAFLGVDVSGFTAQQTSKIVFSRNTAKTFSTFAVGGSLGLIDIRSNILTTSGSTTNPAMKLSLSMSGSPVLLLADNRMEILATGAFASIQTTCASYPFGSSTQMNSTIIMTNNFLSGTGDNSVYACRGILIMRNNFLNAQSKMTHQIATGSSLKMAPEDGNILSGCAVLYTTDADAGTVDIDLRSVGFLSFSFVTRARYSRLRLDGVQISGNLDVRPTVGVDTDSVSIFVASTNVGGLSTVNVGNPINRYGYIHMQSSRFLGGLAMVASSIPSNVLISTISRVIIDSCAIDNFMTLSLRPVSIPWTVSNNTITTAASQTSSITTTVDNTLGEAYNNKFLKGASTSRLSINIAGVATYAGGCIFTGNTFDVVTTLVNGGAVYAKTEFNANSFKDALSLATATNHKLRLFANNFAGVVTKSFAAGTMAADGLQSGCNTDASGAISLVDWDARFMDFSCSASTSISFCWGQKSSSITASSSLGMCTPSLPSGSSAFDSTAEWAPFPISIPQYVSFFSSAPLIEPLSQSTCLRNPIYNLGNVTWPPIPQPIPTTTATVTVTASPTTTNPATTTTTTTATASTVSPNTPTSTSVPSQPATTNVAPTTSPTTGSQGSSSTTTLSPTSQPPTSTSLPPITSFPPSSTPTQPTTTGITPSWATPSTTSPTQQPTGNTGGSTSASSTSTDASPTDPSNTASSTTVITSTTDGTIYPPTNPSSETTGASDESTNTGTTQPSSSASATSQSVTTDGATTDGSNTGGQDSTATDDNGNPITAFSTTTTSVSTEPSSANPSSTSPGHTTQHTSVPTATSSNPATVTAITTTAWPAYTTTTRPSERTIICPHMAVTPTEIFADPTQSGATAEFTVEIFYTAINGKNNYLYDGPAILINASLGLVSKIADSPRIDDSATDENGYGTFTSGTGSFMPLDSCEITGSHTLHCTVSVTSLTPGNHFVVSNGYIVQPSLNCSSNLAASFMYTVANNAANEASDAIGSSIAGGASLITLLSAADIQLYAMLLSSPCSSRNDVARVSVLRYFVSPFTSLGNTWVIVGGAGIILFVILLQLIMAWHFVNSRRVRWADATAAVRFPSISYMVACYLYVGIAQSSFAMFSMHDTMVDIAGIFGIIILIVVPCVCWYYVHSVFVGKWQPYTQFYSKPFHKRWLYPDGFWQPPEQRKPFGGMFLFCREMRLYFAPYALIVIILASMFLMSFGDKIPCFERFVIVSLIFFVAAIFVALVRPHRRPLSAVIEFISFVLLGVQSVLKAMIHTADPEEVSSLVSIDLGVSYAYLAVIVFRVVTEVIYMYLEKRYWMKFSFADGDEDVETMGKSRALLDQDEDEGVGMLPNKNKNLRGKGGKNLKEDSLLEPALVLKNRKNEGSMNTDDSDFDFSSSEEGDEPRGKNSLRAKRSGGTRQPNDSFAMEMNPISSADPNNSVYSSFASGSSGVSSGLLQNKTQSDGSKYSSSDAVESDSDSSYDNDDDTDDESDNGTANESRSSSYAPPVPAKHLNGDSGSDFEI